MTDDETRWAKWEAMLANPELIGRVGHSDGIMVSPDDPVEGFFRVRYNKQKPWEPVHIWREDAQWFAKRGDELVDAWEVWNWCCRYPISVEEYDHVRAGNNWSREDPTVAEQIRKGQGDNSAGLSEDELLAADIQTIADGIRAYAVIKDEQHAAQAQSLRSRLLELGGRAEKIREKLVRPHLDGQKAVNGKWQPVVQSAQAAADTVRTSLKKFETDKLNAQIARDRLAEAARQEAQRIADDAAAAGKPEPMAPEPAPPPPPAVFTGGTVKGDYGRAATVTAKVVLDKITDQAAVYAHFSQNSQVVALLTKLATSAVKNGLTVPGTTTKPEADVR